MNPLYSPHGESDWRARLRACLRPPCAVLGIGQRMRGDDAAGPAVLDLIHERCAFACLDGGPAPENMLGRVARFKPATLLLIDAVHFAAPPGSIRLFDPAEMQQQDISTHGTSPGVLLEFLRGWIETEALLLGIQPQSLVLGAPMSEACRGAVRLAAHALIELSHEVARCTSSPSPRTS